MMLSLVMLDLVMLGLTMLGWRCARCRFENLGDEEEFAGGFAGFEVAVGLGGVR